VRSGAHARDDGSFGRSAGSQTLKGAALIAVAVIIGFVLLKTAPRSATTITTGSLSHPTTTKAPKSSSHGSTPIGPAATTSTTTPAHPVAQVVVLVANGSGVGGLAGKVRTQLGQVGYDINKSAINASATNLTSTSVYYEPGYQADALNIANTLSLGPNAAMPVPSPAPVPSSDLTGADVLVVAGTDIAGSSSGTTEAPAGNTIAPSPTQASSSSQETSAPTTTAERTTTTVARTTTTEVVHDTSTTAASSTTTTR
jgi:hypothetical protein